MIKIILVIFLIVSNCTKYEALSVAGVRKFAVGDCLVILSGEPESWDTTRLPSELVEELGKHSYKIHYIYNGKLTNIIDSLEYGKDEDTHQKAPCPKNLLEKGSTK